MIAATGFDEGDTLPVQAVSTFSIVPMLADAAEGKVPIVACGGIADERTAKAAFALGAEGLLVGIAFLLSEESLVAENIKKDAVGLNAEDMLMYRVLPAFYRTIPGELPNKLVEMSKTVQAKRKYLRRKIAIWESEMECCLVILQKVLHRLVLESQ